MKDEVIQKLKWEKLTNRQITKEWSLKEMIKAQGEAGNVGVPENFKVIKGELYKKVTNRIRKVTK